MALIGDDILNALNDLKDPASIEEIVAHLSSKNKGSATALIEATKALLEAGVRFGCVVEEENKYRCKEQTKGMSSSKGREQISENKQIERKIFSGDDGSDNDSDYDCNDTADCYGPTSRRRRSQSRKRSRSRSRSSKRLSSRRKRNR